MIEAVANDRRPRTQHVQPEGGGASKAFSFNFPILSVEDVYVALDDTIQPLSAYTVTDYRDGKGGIVVFQEQPIVGTIVTIWRDMPFDRQDTLGQDKALSAQDLNDALDRAALLLRQAEAIARDSLHRRPQDPDVDLVLPSIQERSGRLLSFDDLGNLEAANAALDPLSAKVALAYQAGSATAPLVRPDGQALRDGDLYFDTVLEQFFVYSKATWNAAISAEMVLGRDGSVPLSGDLDAAGNSFANVSGINGRSHATDSAKLDTVEPGANDRDHVARDHNMITAMDIARLDGLTAYAFLNTYLDDFSDGTGISPTDSSGYDTLGDGYIRPAGGASQNVIIWSQAVNVDLPPLEARGYVDVEELDAASENVDFVLSISRDNGVSWVDASLSPITTASPSRAIFASSVDLSGQPTGTVLRLRLQTHNSKNLRLHAWAVQADQPLSL